MTSFLITTALFIHLLTLNPPCVIHKYLTLLFGGVTLNHKERTKSSYHNKMYGMLMSLFLFLLMWNHTFYILWCCHGEDLAWLWRVFSCLDQTAHYLHEMTTRKWTCSKKNWPCKIHQKPNLQHIENYNIKQNVIENAMEQYRYFSSQTLLLFPQMQMIYMFQRE